MSVFLTDSRRLAPRFARKRKPVHPWVAIRSAPVPARVSSPENLQVSHIPGTQGSYLTPAHSSDY